LSDTTVVSKFDEMVKTENLSNEENAVKKQSSIVANFVKFIYRNEIADSPEDHYYKEVMEMMLTCNNYHNEDFWASSIRWLILNKSLLILQERLREYKMSKLKVIPFNNLSENEKLFFDLEGQKAENIFAIQSKGSIITLLSIESNKIKQFLTIRNLEGIYYFIPNVYN
jgi:hypothetical protein